MNNNYGLLIAVVIILIIVGVVYAVYSGTSSQQGITQPSPSTTYVGGDGTGGQNGSTIMPITSGSPAFTGTSMPGTSVRPSASATAQGSATGAVHKISVDGNEYVFLPSEIRVKAGEKVQITFTNKGDRPHDMQIPDLNVGTGATPLPGHQSKTFEFTAPSQKNASGLQFLCTVPGHADRGMVGKLIVE